MTLCVGGATSIDRKPNPDKVGFDGKPYKGRKEGCDYWMDEVFVLKTELLKDLKNIDIVVTHSCPNFCEPRTKQGLSDWIKHDVGLIDECERERNDHSKMYDILKANNNPIKYWFYGHYHFHNMEIIDDTKFVLLDIEELYDLKN